jgi:hypothetical protein
VSFPGQPTDRYLAYRPDLADAEWKDLTHDYPVTARDWKDGKLSIEFEGTRADIIAATEPARHPAASSDGPEPETRRRIPDIFRLSSL